MEKFGVNDSIPLPSWSISWPVICSREAKLDSHQRHAIRGLTREEKKCSSGAEMDVSSNKGGRGSLARKLNNQTFPERDSPTERTPIPSVEGGRW